MDAVWTRTLWRTFEHLVDPLGGAMPDDEDLSGRWKALWDPSGLHLLVEVHDDTLVHSEEHDSRYWLDDNVEVFVDGDT